MKRSIDSVSQYTVRNGNKRRKYDTVFIKRVKYAVDNDISFENMEDIEQLNQDNYTKQFCKYVEERYNELKTQKDIDDRLRNARNRLPPSLEDIKQLDSLDYILAPIKVMKDGKPMISNRIYMHVHSDRIDSSCMSYICPFCSSTHFKNGNKRNRPKIVRHSHGAQEEQQATRSTHCIGSQNPYPEIYINLWRTDKTKIVKRIF